LILSPTPDGAALKTIYVHGVCGQAPSDYQELAIYLVGLGIHSISLNPDTVLEVTALVLHAEKRMATEQKAEPGK